MNLIETGAEVERAWFATFLDDQVDDPMQTTPSEEGFKSFASNAGSMLAIARSEIERLISQEFDRV